MPRRTQQTHPRRHVLALFAALFLTTPALAQDSNDTPTVDTVTMKDGRTVAGPILKETPQMIWIDLGFDVLAVPRTEILDIVRAQSVQAKVTTNELYRTVDASRLPVSTPAELAKRFGEAVIKVSTPSGLGSGYIIHPDGYAITNAHVIQGETRIQATVFEQGSREFTRVTIDDVKIIAVNAHIDLALIKLPQQDARPFHYVYIQDKEDLEVGQEVFAIGNPLGLERTLSSGVIATTQRNFEGLTFVQTTAEINPGNSGGPLFNLKGEVIGTINMGALSADGIGFAIPARYVRDFIRNNEAFAYDRENPNSGYNYLNPPPRRDFSSPSILDDSTAQ
ncbi:MAG: trypsin-like peptidase domain-containing protein [Phycisphaerales bacterium]|nr:trypsin-like peptidase domain-containing protein [Phycisphaerales bacterium]